MRDVWLRVGNLRIHCLAAGASGPPVLLLHGGGLDSAALTYRFAIAQLAERRRVFAPDLPGFGESDPPEEAWGIEEYVTFLGQLVDELALDRASVVGMSLGGGMALGFSLAAPSRVKQLVLVDSYGLGREVPGGAASYLLVHLPLMSELIWLLLRRSRMLVRMSLKAIVSDPRVVDEDLVDEVSLHLRRPVAGKTWRDFQRREVQWSGARTSYLDRLIEIRVPTLIVHGRNDPLVPVAWAERAHRLIERSVLCVIEGCGHWPPREKPDEFNCVVSGFLAG